MRKSWFVFLMCVLLGAWTASKAQATLMLDLHTGGAQVPCGSCGANGTTFGWRFTVLAPITVDGIGVWDAGANGIGSASIAGIWTADGTLLASATVSDGSTPVASASSDGDWLFESITPLTLTPGIYEVGAMFLAITPFAQVNVPFVMIPEITGVTGVQGTLNAGFTAPLTPFHLPIFGPTLLLQDRGAPVQAQAAPVPEPSTWLLCGTGLALVLGCWRRRQTASA